MVFADFVRSCVSGAVLTHAALAGASSLAVDEMPPVVPGEFAGDLRELPPAVLGESYVHPPLRAPRKDRTLMPGGNVAGFAAGGELVLGPMPPLGLSFAGMSLSGMGSGWPPDTNGMAGDEHYIQAVNRAFAIYSKTGVLQAAFTEDRLWAGNGTLCDGNSKGDPVVIYDPFSRRWILTNFAFSWWWNTAYYQCIAVSKTSDPVTGGWWLYPIRADDGVVVPAGYMNDYPKFGIWPDCLYMAANEFAGDEYRGVMVASFSREDLESGAPLTYSVKYLPANSNDAYTLIPSNASSRHEGSTPPDGTPNYVTSQSTSRYAYAVREFVAGPDCGDGGTLSEPVYVDQQAYEYPAVGVAQPNTTNTLDTLDDRLMQKVQYRRVGEAESLWVVHSVREYGNPASTVRPQWAEIDVSGGIIATTPTQQRIYAPDTTLNRWMGSIATDHNGNAALGYSTSNGTAPNFPSIAYAGRLATDPLNEMPRGENQLIAGGGSQTNTCNGGPCQRWGDYSEMSIDPVDDCTFWYTNQYYDSQASASDGNWKTRIGAFRFPECESPAEPTATPTPSASPGAATPTDTPSAPPAWTPTPTRGETPGTGGGCAAVAPERAGGGWGVLAAIALGVFGMRRKLPRGGVP